MAQGWKKDYSRYKGFFLNIWTLYNSKPSLKIYLELMLTLGTITVFALFAIKPTILTIIDLNNEIKSKENTIQKLDQKLASLKTASSLLQTESSNLSFINQSVPSSADVEIAIGQIEKLASLNSITLTNVSVTNVILKGTLDKTKKSGDLEALSNDAGELPVSFSASGSFLNLFQFLQSIENLRRPIKIDAIIFNSSSNAEDNKVITLTISGRMPYAN